MLKEVFFGKCPACGGISNIDEPLCNECYEKIEYAGHLCLSCGYPVKKAGAYCPKCAGKVKFYGDNVFILYKYRGVIRSLLLSVKFNYNIRSVYYLHKLIYLNNIDINSYDIITYVPSHFFRNFKRFKHPAKATSDYLNKISNKKHIKVLKRFKKTTFQYKLNKNERKNNVENAFKVCININMLKILLVDDIFTTGSTLNECAKLLKSHGASQVDCFVLAID